MHSALLTWTSRLSGAVSCELFRVGGRKCTKLGDGGRDNFKSGINFGIGGVPAKAEAQAGFRVFMRKTDRGKDVRRLNSARRASCSDRASEAFKV